MEIEINTNTIKEIEDIIIPNFCEVFKDKCIGIDSIAVSLQAILDKVKELKEKMEDNNGQ